MSVVLFTLHRCLVEYLVGGALGVQSRTEYSVTHCVPQDTFRWEAEFLGVLECHYKQFTVISRISFS